MVDAVSDRPHKLIPGSTQSRCGLGARVWAPASPGPTWDGGAVLTDGSAADPAQDEAGRRVLVAVQVGQVHVEAEAAGAELVVRVAPGADARGERVEGVDLGGGPGELAVAGRGPGVEVGA